MRILSFAIVTIITGGILSQCTSHHRSHAVKGEQRLVHVNEAENRDVLALAMVDTQAPSTRAAGAVDIVGLGVSLATQGVKRLINSDKTNYTAEYKGGANELLFYSTISTKEDGVLDLNGIQFSSFDFVRKVGKGKKVKSDTALVVRFELDQQYPYEIINNSIFRLKMTKLRLDYARAKIPLKRWYAPWTWFSKKEENINLEFEIVIKATWFSKDGVFYDNVTIGRFSKSVNDLPIDSVKQKIWLDTCRTSPLRYQNRRLTGYSMLVPRSFSSIIKNKSRGNNKIEYDASFGQGMYSIEVKVKEAAKQSFAMKELFESSDQIINSYKYKK